MKLLETVHAACRQQHFAASTEQIYCRCVEEYVRYHKQRSEQTPVPFICLSRNKLDSDFEADTVPVFL